MMRVVVAEGCGTAWGLAGEGKDRSGSALEERPDTSAGAERADSGDAARIERLIDHGT
jgi:hypothetical protein